LLASAGLDIPVSALRVQIAIVHRPLELEEPHFVYLDTAAGMFTRPWGPGRSLIGVGGGDQHDEVDPHRYDERNDPGYAALAIAAAARRIPAMSKAVYLHGHAGLYDMTPDAHPIIGNAPLDGLTLAVGFSGAGFKKGPAVGQCVAELIVDGRSSLVDLEPFRLDRFATEDWQRPWSDTEYVFSSDFGHKL
jgi:glycine/D-amino acid oxidase-like deaminating enzyme